MTTSNYQNRLFTSPLTAAGLLLTNHPAARPRPEETYSRVWLIDDDPLDTFYAERAIRDAHFAQEVVTFAIVEEALQLLNYALQCGFQLLPSVIFLGVSIPNSSGWDFADAFEQLPASVRASSVLYLMSSLPATYDLRRLQRASFACGWLAKPLTGEDVEAIKR